MVEGQEASTTASKDEGVLWSLRQYAEIRRVFQQQGDVIYRPRGSNVDVLMLNEPLEEQSEGDEGRIITMPDESENKTIAICDLSVLFPFTTGNHVPIRSAFEDSLSAALAIHHLNTGNDDLVPEIANLPERCPVRFTMQSADTEFQGGVTLDHVAHQTGSRGTPSSTDVVPCAFLGAYRSAVSIPMSIVTGLLGYPQVSPASTSAALDDRSQYPLFGRTVPSDAGNAIPLVRYLREVLEIRHLVVINVNDAYGNAFVEGMRAAAALYAPDLLLAQIPLDETAGSIENAVRTTAETEYRFVFALVFTIETHDALLTEAYNQGVAGNGLHNWIFGDSFSGTLEGRSFEVDSPLHLAYRGVGLLELSGGVPGMPKYDKYVSLMSELDNPTDLKYLLNTLWPQREEEEYDVQGDVLNQVNFLEIVSSGFSPFAYEAAVALGLAACASYNPVSRKLDGEAHYDAFKKTNFTGISGSIVFNHSTGTREPASALYKVANYREMIGEDGVVFEPVVTNLFQDNAWNVQEDYVFNDGTTTLPVDISPPPSEDENEFLSLPVLIGGPVFVVFIACVVYFLIREHKKKSNDNVWQVKKEELHFSDPPEVLGQGTFGMVLLGEYRGTQVAVKRVIPPTATPRNDGNVSMFSTWFDPKNNKNILDASSANDASMNRSMDTSINTNGSESESDTMESGYSSMLGSMSGVVKGSQSMVSGLPGQAKRRLRSDIRRMKEEFIEEMRYLSRLRHPCVTTVMGAVIDRHEDPMLIMEYMDHGSLYDLLHNETMALDGEILLPVLRDISQGMRFLHSAEPQVLHGDLKAANILVDNRFRGKVADFGLSQKKNMGGTGTPFWMAPELLRRESPNTSASDVFSFGVILYEVFSRKDPYEGEKAREVLRAVADKNIKKRVAPPAHMPDQIKALMLDCNEEDPDRRPSFEEIDKRLKRFDAEHVNPTDGKKGKTQVSLFDIFPKHIAEAMRDGRKVEAEHKDVVTIFFSDIVGFTTISATLDPRKVANMLDRLYHKFDDLSHEHDIYKVETIGDAFMAVSNLVKDQPDDHCKRIAEFSIAALKAAKETMIDEEDPEKGFVEIRVGFHSGSVVADVVGNRNPRYCLFGDAVNTASRMESNSSKNRINCSRSAAEILRKQAPELPMRSRGEINIKGKGMMKCYWVNEQGRRDSRMHQETDQERAYRKIRMLEDTINGFDKAKVISDSGKPEHRSGSRTLATLEEVSEGLSTEFGPKKRLDSMGSTDSQELETSLNDRILRSSRRPVTDTSSP